MENYGMNSYYGIIDSKTGMTEDVNSDLTPTLAQEEMNYRQWHWSVQERMYLQWVALNDNRDLTSDLTNLCGVKDGEHPFTDDWYHVYPWRRRPHKLYPDQIRKLK